MIPSKNLKCRSTNTKMCLLIVALITVYELAVVVSDTSSKLRAVYCSEYGGTAFTSMLLNDLIFLNGLLFESSARSKTQCGKMCASNEDCVIFTYRPAMNGLSAICRGHGPIHNEYNALVVLPMHGAKSYAADRPAALCHIYDGYTLKCGRCIRVIESRLPYFDAMDMCWQLDHGHLLVTKTREDLKFADMVAEYHGMSGVWLGAYKVNDSDFTWTDGTPLLRNSSLWNEGDPDVGNHLAKCVALRALTGRLFDNWCEHNRSAICQIDV